LRIQVGWVSYYPPPGVLAVNIIEFMRSPDDAPRAYLLNENHPVVLRRLTIYIFLDVAPLCLWQLHHA